MRTTLAIQDDLLEYAKRMAVERRCTLGAVVEDALRQSLLNQKSTSALPTVKLTTVGGLGLHPEANLSSNAELLEYMESQ